MTRARRPGREGPPIVIGGSAAHSEAEYPRRRTAGEPKPTAAPPGGAGYRATRRSSKAGRRMRREARAERTRADVQERAEHAASALWAGLRRTAVAGLAVVGALILLALIATGINATARFIAKREAAANQSPDAVKERAKDNLLIIGSGEGATADFLAVRVDDENEQVFGIAIPDGAFMEVPGQGFERIGDSFKAGSDVSMAAISNYLSVPFEKYIVVDSDTYQAALTDQSLRGVGERITASNLSPQEMERLRVVMDRTTTDRVALVPLPVRPISLGDQTYFEPQRDQVADLLLSWWGVRLGDDEGIVRVIVYNGAGVAGIAGEAAQVLIGAGMRVVDTRNADRFDYKTTLIVVQNGDMSGGEQVRSVLGVGELVDQPTQQDVADIIVIIGSDWTPPKE